jgi:hypothetical protein
MRAMDADERGSSFLHRIHFDVKFLVILRVFDFSFIPKVP